MSNKCHELHERFNQLERFSFPYDKTSIPTDGIYILFEKGEQAHQGDRIVRIGTHTGEDQLRSRLEQHFIKENKDRSIFRKNIGRALLNKTNDDYLRIWELDLTTRKNKEKYSHLIDKQYQKEIEYEITRVLQSGFSFSVLKESDKENRLLFEARLIAEVSNCEICKASQTWLGNYSTKAKIRNSGLWQVNELYKSGFKEDEYTVFNKKFL